MPRANRYIVAGHVYHITHRCHDRQFLLRFAKDRHTYRRRLLMAARPLNVCLLNYTITSNHVHLIIWAESPDQIAALMQKAAGEFAREYNRRKERSGAFWEGRYQVTMVEGGPYLEHCLVYVDLNMVLCGVVEHPSQWDWTGYGELMGQKKRNRVVRMTKLLELLGGVELAEFRRHYEKLIMEKIEKDSLKREAHWTESLAVGSKEYIAAIQPLIRHRQETVMSSAAQGCWVLSENSYGSFFAGKK